MEVVIYQSDHALLKEGERRAEELIPEPDADGVCVCHIDFMFTEKCGNKNPSFTNLISVLPSSVLRPLVEPLQWCRNPGHLERRSLTAPWSPPRSPNWSMPSPRPSKASTRR
ncbi:uncharacterized protein LOC132883603 isoform X2 [Neoarius graeffei]|uniref:uncharacterized protein LOC132883603 isoform X2 n=1 Tax=Neoarius graeffei TaxID=443677 RepID=UPI00298C0B01|nr:uncharacterized protein LOC132883603 isoform X2 [Neoarius graeffei]